MCTVEGICTIDKGEIKSIEQIIGKRYVLKHIPNTLPKSIFRSFGTIQLWFPSARTAVFTPLSYSWWRHQMETFSALLAICAGNSPATGDFPAQRLVTRSFDVFFDLRPNKGLSKQSWGWWFDTPSRPLWHQCNDWNRNISGEPSQDHGCWCPGSLRLYQKQWYWLCRQAGPCLS